MVGYNGGWGYNTRKHSTTYLPEVAFDKLEALNFEQRPW